MLIHCSGQWFLNVWTACPVKYRQILDSITKIHFILNFTRDHLETTRQPPLTANHLRNNTLLQNKQESWNTGWSCKLYKFTLWELSSFVLIFVFWTQIGKYMVITPSQIISKSLEAPVTASHLQIWRADRRGGRCPWPWTRGNLV